YRPNIIPYVRRTLGERHPRDEQSQHPARRKRPPPRRSTDPPPATRDRVDGADLGTALDEMYASLLPQPEESTNERVCGEEEDPGQEETHPADDEQNGDAATHDVAIAHRVDVLTREIQELRRAHDALVVRVQELTCDR
ncbi:MAG: hypothetical protein VXW98_03870, partial [Actinomycetota bacterium]|nr:hypothetical protein [Actinomycetota bacterium]